MFSNIEVCVEMFKMPVRLLIITAIPYFILGSVNAETSAYDDQADVVLNNIEGSREIASCPYSVRTQLLSVDLNADGTPEWLSLINCLTRTYEPGWWQNTVHNEYVGHAWMALELTSPQTVADATSKYFGTNAIDVSLGGPSGFLGGYGYIATEDLNGDGFPEVSYYGSRDDTRPIDADGTVNEDQLFTWRTQQSILMSNVQGTYSVGKLGEPVPAFRSLFLPNPNGAKDLFIQSYEGRNVYTLSSDGQNWSDNTEYWASKPNFDRLNSYANLLAIEDSNFLLTDENGIGVAVYGAGHDGFELLDEWEAPGERFTYQWPCFECEGGVAEYQGFYWRDQAVFGMAFEDFYAVKLYENEPPVIVTHALGFAMPEHKKYERVLSDEIYDNRYGVAQELGHVLTPPAHLYIAFRIIEGKLVPIETDLLPDNIFRSSVYKTRFSDINADGLDDLILLTGQESKPALFINNGMGRFRRVNPSILPENPLGGGHIPVENGTLYYGTESDLADYNGDGLSDFAFYHFGFDGVLNDWYHETYAQDARWNSGDIHVFFGKSPLSATEDVLSLAESLEYVLDHDLDTQKNVYDPDDDNDGVLDNQDAFPVDSNEFLDTDADGIGDNADLDDDGDGYPDSEDAFPLDGSEWLDSNGNGIGDNAETDARANLTRQNFSQLMTLISALRAKSEVQVKD